MSADDAGKVSYISTRSTIRQEHIPQELKDVDSWFLWRLETPPGRTKPSKPPYQPSGEHGAVDDPRTWSSFRKVMSVMEGSKGPGFHGVGFVLGPHAGDMVAWDLDKVMNPRTLELVDWAQRIVDRLSSYTEITPSGEGLRVWARGTIPIKRKNSRGLSDWSGGSAGAVETYSDLGFVTVTGNRYPGTPAGIQSRDQEDLWREFHEKGPRELSSLLRDENMQKFWDGRWSEILVADQGSPSGFRQKYGSQSEADLAFMRQLVITCSGDGEAADVQFRKSKMMRPKWDETNHFADSPSGETYGQHTIRTAVKSYERSYNLTDTGNAKRFARIAGDRVRYASPGGWHVWDGRRIVQDRKQSVYLICEEVCREVRTLAEEVADEKVREAMIKHSKNLEGRGQIESMLRLAQARPPIPILGEDLDCKDDLLCVANGVIEGARTLRPHRFEDLITKMSPVAYVRAAKAPRWEQFLREILPNDEIRHFVHKAVGYSMTGSVREQRFFIAYGTGKNGKSKFFEAVSHVMGDHFTRIPSSALLVSRNEQHPTALMLLKGARMALAAELQEGRALNEEVSKIVTGEGEIQARLMGKDYVTFRSTAKLWIMTNHEPTIKGTDVAIWRRVTEVPFTQFIPEEDRDPDLGDKLLAEAEGILAWAVEGWRMWLDEGLKLPQVITRATEEYRERMDVVQSFLEDECEEAPRERMTFSSLFDLYVRWAERNGERPMSSKAFSSRLLDKKKEDGSLKFEKFRGGGHVLFVTGLKPRTVFDQAESIRRSYDL